METRFLINLCIRKETPFPGLGSLSRWFEKPYSSKYNIHDAYYGGFLAASMGWFFVSTGARIPCSMMADLVTESRFYPHQKEIDALDPAEKAS